MPVKYDRCVKAVKASNRKSGRSYNPYAVCKKSTDLRSRRGRR